MSERWETYHVGNVVRLRRVETRPRRARAKPAEPDLAALKKDELVALAEERGVDASGTKAEIAERLTDG